jgi:hypothetical protein
MAAKLNPLSRNPDLEFKTISITLSTQPEVYRYSQTTATFLGVVTATAFLEGWQDTQMYYRLCSLTDNSGQRILLGSRCGFLHTPHINARHTSAEHLWCMKCWSNVNIPFYLYYRHFEDHVIDHIPPCSSCSTRFQIWDANESLRQDFTYLFSSYHNESLQEQVEQLLPPLTEWQKEPLPQAHPSSL